MSLKDFQILSKIGQGSFAKVFKAQRIVDNKIYALKQVHYKIIMYIDKNKSTGCEIKTKCVELNQITCFVRLQEYY